MKREYLLLIFIIFLAFFLRFWQLGQNPPSLTWDEAAWGYNAYSLGLDGRDEFGKFLPVQYLESFGDFKPPLYAYLGVLPVKLFGLNEFAVRFPSAFFGTLTVLIAYFLTKRIFSFQYPPPRNPFGHLGGVAERLPRGETVALFSALFLAISPWHINLSRAAFEANVATFFLVTGVWLFLRGVEGKKWCLPFSVISFILSMYTFNTARMVAPVLMIVLAIAFRKTLLEQKKLLLITVLIGIIFIAPLAQFLVTPQAQLRFREVNIFSDIGIIERTNQEIENDGNAGWSKILHNRRFAYAVEFLRHYFDNLNPSFLFIKGDGNPKFSTQDVGEMYLWDLPFFILGVLVLFRKRQGNWWLIPLWLVIGIIPSATARETPHALRIETTLPTFQILTAYGFISFLTIISKMRIKYSIFALTSLFLIFNFLYYFRGYWVHYSREFSGEWQYGYKETISYIQSVENQYEEIVVTEDLGRPYIYFLFHMNYSPQKFRNEAVVEREVFGFVHIKSFGKYRFARDFSIVDNKNKKVLYINVSQQVPQGALLLKTFNLLDDKPALVAYTL